MPSAQKPSEMSETLKLRARIAELEAENAALRKLIASQADRGDRAQPHPSGGTPSGCDSIHKVADRSENTDCFPAPPSHQWFRYGDMVKHRLAADGPIGVVQVAGTTYCHVLWSGADYTISESIDDLVPYHPLTSPPVPDASRPFDPGLAGPVVMPDPIGSLGPNALPTGSGDNPTLAEEDAKLRNIEQPFNTSPGG